MAEFTFKVKGGREDFRRTSVILLNSGASHPKVADDGTVTVRADRGNPFAGIASQLRNESVKAFFKCDTVRVSGIKNQAGAAEISKDPAPRPRRRVSNCRQHNRPYYAYRD